MESTSFREIRGSGARLSRTAFDVFQHLSRKDAFMESLYVRTLHRRGMLVGPWLPMSVRRPEIAPSGFDRAKSQQLFFCMLQAFETTVSDNRKHHGT